MDEQTVTVTYICNVCGLEWTVEEVHTAEEMKEGVTLSRWGEHTSDHPEVPAHG